MYYIAFTYSERPP